MNEELIEITGPAHICTIIGADTFLGSHLVRHLVENGRTVYGYAQNEKFDLDAEPSVIRGEGNASFPAAPELSDWMLICLDPRVGFDKYIRSVRQICRHLLAKKYYGGICFLSSADICFSGQEPISESSPVLPRTERDLCIATAENLLNVMLYHTGNEALPYIMRLGSIYGDETGMGNPFGFIDAQIRKARESRTVDVPVCAEMKRSVLHISDACEAVIQLMASENCPTLVNIPGEEKTIAGITAEIMDRYQAKPHRISPQQDDQFYCVADQHLSDTLFRSTIDFTRSQSLGNWLAVQPR